MCIHPSSIPLKQPNHSRNFLPKNEDSDSCDYLTPTEFAKYGSFDCLSILQYNVRGISSKISSLETLLKDCNVDIAIVNETWLKPSSTIRVQNYNFVGKPRHSKKEVV